MCHGVSPRNPPGFALCHPVSIYYFTGVWKILWKMCKTPFQRFYVLLLCKSSRVKKHKLSLDKAISRCYNAPCTGKQVRFPRPHPRLKPKGQHGVTSPDLPVLFCCDVGARPAARILFVWRCFPIANTGHQTNEDIRDKEVRLISESGEQLGIMSSQEALRLAE